MTQFVEFTDNISKHFMIYINIEKNVAIKRLLFSLPALSFFLLFPLHMTIYFIIFHVNFLSSHWLRSVFQFSLSHDRG